MAKKTDEYTYPDQTSSSEYTESATSESTENVQSVLMNKRIMLPLGIMAVAILINTIWGGETKAEVAEIQPPKQEVVAASSADEVSAQELEFAKMQNELHAEKLSENKRAIDEVTEINKRNNAQLSSVKGKFNELQYQVDELKTDMVGIHNEMMRTTAAINALVNEISAMKKPKKVKRIAKKKRIKPRNYSVRAIIEGRAWVKWDKGGSLTVTVGDSIPTYGKVTAIHPVEGIVQTSSGRVIQFSADE